MTRFRLALAVLLPLLALTTAHGDELPRLNEQEQKMLQLLDPEAAAKCVALAKQADEWVMQIEEYRRLAKEMMDAAKRDEVVLKVAREVVKTPPELKKLLGIGQQVEEMLAAYERKLNELKAAAELEVEQRKQAIEKARGEATAAIADELTKINELIRVARNPAQYARNFLEGEVKAKYLGKSHDFGDIKLTITQKDFRKSLFSPDANIAVALDYAAVAFQAKATGLYFKYRDGQLPEPMLDKMKVETSSLDALANKGLKSIGDAIPDFGLPIQIKNPTIAGFDGADKERRGVLSFRVIMGFGEMLGAAGDALKAQADVTVQLNGKTELGPDGITGDIGNQVILGASGMMLDGGTIQLKPADKEKALTLGTWLAPVAGGKNGVAMKVTLSMGFPISEKGFTVEGTLLLARTVEIGKVTGTITKNKVSGSLQMPSPGSPLPRGVFEADFAFQLDKEAFVAKGSAALFKLTKMEMDLMLKFDGNATLTAKRSMKIAEVEVNATLGVKIEPGFKRVVVDATFNAEVDLKFRKLAAAVEVRAQHPDKPAVVIDARAVGMKVHFQVNDLSELTPERLTEEFLKELPNIIDQFGEALASMEKNGARALARAEEKFRNGVSAEFKRVGMDKLDTGNAELNKRLGELSEGGKNVIDWGVKSRQKLGKAFSELKQPDQAAKDAVDQLGKEISNLGDAISDLASEIGGDSSGKKRDKARKERERDAIERKQRENQQRQQQSDQRLVRLVQALNGGEGGIDKPVPAVRPGDKPPARVTALRIDCETAVSDALDDTKDAQVVFLFHTRGFTVAGDSRRAESDIKSASVRFTSLLDPSAQAKARIELPSFVHGSDLPAHELLFDRIADLIERYVPGVEVEGRHKEKWLVLENKTDEPVRVWVQANTVEKSENGRAWAWIPGGPGESQPAILVLLAPGEREPVMRGARKASGPLKINLPPTEPVSAIRIRYWAESESGQMWSEFQDKDRWIVDARPSDGRRIYNAPERRTYTLALTASEGKRTFKERGIAVRNDTALPLKVQASVTSTRPGGAAVNYSAAPVTIAPGKAVTLCRPDDNWILRGGAVRITASDEKGESFRWEANRGTGLPLADQNGYAAEKLGMAVLTLDDPTATLVKPTTWDAATIAFRLPADTVKVPAVEKRLLRDAQAMLARVGLKGITAASAAPNDLVTASRPDGWVRVGADISLTVSIDIPSLRGQTLAQAQSWQASAKVGVKYNNVTRMTEDARTVGRTLIGSQSRVGLTPRPAALEVEVIAYIASTVEVPNIKGKSAAQAESALKATRLTLRTSNDPTVGPVDHQDPPAGKRVAPNTAVTAIFPMRMPQLRGLSWTQGKARLDAMGLTYRYLNSPTEGAIESTEPAAGAAVRRGDLVTVRFPTATPRTVAVPNLIRRSIADARAEATRVGLSIRVVSSSTAPAPDASMAGVSRVAGQKTPSGQLVAMGTVIDVEGVTYTAAPPPPPGRDVKGLWRVTGNLKTVATTIQNGKPVQTTKSAPVAMGLCSLKVRGQAESGTAPQGGMPKEWQRGTYQFNGETLSIDVPSGLQLSGSIRWVSAGKFLLTAANGVTYDFDAAGF